MKAMADSMRLNTVLRVRELYYDLFLAYTNIDLLTDLAALFSRVEDAAVARYAAGMAPQQEVLMAQTEKYMLLEREEMERQKIRSIEAMLNAALGRDTNAALGRPEKPPDAPYGYGLDELITAAYQKIPTDQIPGKDGRQRRGEDQDGKEGILSRCHGRNDLLCPPPSIPRHVEHYGDDQHSSFL